jgi:hypothetical protein
MATKAGKGFSHRLEHQLKTIVRGAEQLLKFAVIHAADQARAMVRPPHRIRCPVGT